MKVKLLPKIFKNEKAQSTVEFALVLPLLLILLLGIVEFGWFLNAKITITSAAREGARVYAIYGDDLVSAQKKVDKIVDDRLIGTTMTRVSGSPTLSPVEPDINGVNMAEVIVTVQVKGLTGFFSKSFLNYFTAMTDENDEMLMSSKASMRVEYYIPNP